MRVNQQPMRQFLQQEPYQNAMFARQTHLVGSLPQPIHMKMSSQPHTPNNTPVQPSVLNEMLLSSGSSPLSPQNTSPVCNSPQPGTIMMSKNQFIKREDSSPQPTLMSHLSKHETNEGLMSHLSGMREQEKSNNGTSAGSSVQSQCELSIS